MECVVCVIKYDKSNNFHCFGCKFDCCITCMKTYIVNQSTEPCCMSCRVVVPYDQFIESFDKNWRLTTYKKYRETILLEKEQSLMQVSVQKLVKKRELVVLKNKYQELSRQMTEINDEMYNIKNFISNNKIKGLKTNFQYTHIFIDKSCNGFLNEKFQCDLCEIHVCNQCFIEKKQGHECDPELVETCKLIKSEAKPCPNCSEYISKINGCDQMFCTLCGTAFSWTTGTIERGTIHNPHAHAFFQNNPDALNNYVNNNNNQCRRDIPDYSQMSSAKKKITDQSILKKIDDLYRYTAEFRQYSRNDYVDYINNVNDENEDLRFKFLEKDIDENKFKSSLFARNKKRNLRKAVYGIVIPTSEIIENYLWTIIDITKKLNRSEEINKEVLKILNIIYELHNISNETISKIYLENNYTPKDIFLNNFKINNV